MTVEVECKDCSGTGKALGQNGQKHVCTNCGGSGSYNVEESFEESVEKAREAAKPFYFFERRSSFNWKAGAGGAGIFEHRDGNLVLVNEGGPVLKMETGFERLAEYLQSKVDSGEVVD